MRRWSDSSTQGVQITFALPDSQDLEPLKGKEGRRFMAVLVEIADDETPVQPAPQKDTRGPLCREACDLCKMPEFQRWVYECEWAHGCDEPSEQNAKDVILMICGVRSRKDLDTNADAAADFRNRIRIPFMQWMRRRQAA